MGLTWWVWYLVSLALPCIRHLRNRLVQPCLPCGMFCCSPENKTTFTCDGGILLGVVVFKTKRSSDRLQPSFPSPSYFWFSNQDCGCVSLHSCTGLLSTFPVFPSLFCPSSRYLQCTSCTKGKDSDLNVKGFKRFCTKNKNTGHRAGN